MVTGFANALLKPISSDRLESYRPTGGTDKEMLINYLWNMELCEALYPTLQALEVSYRNSIHAEATALYNTPNWFDKTDVLMPQQLVMIAEARRKIRDAGRPETAGRIVAAATFGFWTSLMNRPYEQPQSQTRRKLATPRDRLYWHDAASQPVFLLQVFPNLPRSFRTRAVVWQRMNEVRDLRNRVFHHEPVWKRPNLLDEHGKIIEAIGWISPEMQVLASICDRMIEVHATGRSRIESALDARFPSP